MGIAEVIPGVSGGTIAFITGIYEELLATIKAILGPEAWTTLSQQGIQEAWKKANGNFALALLSGMAIGMITGVFAVSHLLESYPILLWAFFFGLILASAWFIGRQVGKWNPATILSLVAGIAIAYWITIASPTEGNTALWFVFLSGAIAISALLLPGISGSFILLLMGMYTYIIPMVKSFLQTQDSAQLLILGVFALGCLVGLATFSRVLTWTFKHYHQQTMALLTGFMIGSLNKIWPWRKPVLGLTEDGQMVQIARGMEVDKIIKEVNLLPAQYASEVGDAFFVPALLLALAGIAFVVLLERWSAIK